MADLNLGMKCIKYMLLTVNAMFVLTGMLVISIGTTIYTIYDDFSHFITDGFFSPAALLIAIGIIMIIVSIFGCLGAAKESTCMTNTFAFLLSLIFILEIAAAIAAYSLRSGLKDTITESFNHSMYAYDKDIESKQAIDFVQEKLECCGVKNYTDWKYTSYGQSHGNSSIFVPASCCLDYDTNNCMAYSYGCVPRLTFIISQSSVLLGTGALTIAFIQFVGIIFSVMLAKAIRQAKTDRERRQWEIREQIVNAYMQMEPHKASELRNPSPVIYVPTIGHTQA